MSSQTRTRLARRRAARAAWVVAVAVSLPAAAPARAADLYWDVNGPAGGGSNTATANGTWGANNFWSTSATGSAATTAWVAGRTAVFSAGANVSGDSNVSVSGTQNAAGITFEEGTVTLGGSGTIALSGVEPAITVGTSAAAARSAVITASLNAAGATGAVRIVRGTTDAATLTLGGVASALPGGLRVDDGGVRINTNNSGALGGATGGAVTVTGSGVLFSSSLESPSVFASIDIANDFVLNPTGGAGSGFSTAFAAAGHVLGTTRLTYGGDISGDADVIISAAAFAPATPASLQATGNGLTVFSGTNTWAGRTIVNVAEGGTFQLGSAGALPPDRPLVFGRGQADGNSIGAMDLAGQNISITSLATNAGGTTATSRGITNSNAAQGGTITVTGAEQTTFVGVIGAISTASMNAWGFSGTDNLAVTLAAAHTGSLTLIGASTYAGATTINGGTLNVAHTASSAATIAGNVIVNAGGLLASAGAAAPAAATARIGGSVTLNDGGVLDPGGAAVGELGIAGGLVINSDSATTGGTLRFTLESATSYDHIDLGAAALTLDDGFHPVEIAAAAGGGAGGVAAGTYTLMNYGSRAFDGVHGFAKTLDPGGGFSYTLDFTDTALRLIVAPLSQQLVWDVGGGGAPIVEGGGTWSDGGTNFFDVGANAGATFSNAGSADVIIGNDAAAAGGTISLGGPVRTGGKLIFGPISPSSPYAIDGGAGAHVLTTVGGITANASATIDAAVTLEASQTWDVAAARTLALGGNLSGAASVVLTKAGEGVLALGGSNEIGSLHVDAGVVAITAGTTKIEQLTIAADARMDLGSNKLITNAPIGVFDGTAYTGIQGEVQRAYNFGAWDMPGLTTSEELAGQNAGPLSGTTTIGVATAEQVLFIGPSETALFAGHVVTGASVIAMYTYAGDVNFDGLVDGADYGTLDNWIQFPGTSGYANGDVNYDGVIDGADYGVLDNTIQLQGAPIPTGVAGVAGVAGVGAAAAVPEPAVLAGVAVAATLLLPRRRGRRGR